MVTQLNAFSKGTFLYELVLDPHVRGQFDGLEDLNRTLNMYFTSRFSELDEDNVKFRNEIPCFVCSVLAHPQMSLVDLNRRTSDYEERN